MEGVSPGRVFAEDPTRPGHGRQRSRYFSRQNTAVENFILIVLGPGNFFAATGTRLKIFRLVPVPAGKNPERSRPEARDIFRPPGINPPNYPGRVFRQLISISGTRP